MAGPLIVVRNREPAGLDGRRFARELDPRPHRNLGSPGISHELDALPDDRLIATAMTLGCPRGTAEQCRHHPPMRFHLVRLWCDVQDSAQGDLAARERVEELCRWLWSDSKELQPEEGGEGYG